MKRPFIYCNHRGAIGVSNGCKRFIGGVACVLTSILIVTSLLVSLPLTTPSADSSKDIVERILTLAPHYPIVISGDLEFADKALSEGWPGTGMEGDPYVISELDIVGNNTECCISVSDTSVHFIIRNCSLREGYGSEIRLENTANATIENNTMTDGTFYAFYCDNCCNVTIANNSVLGGTHGIGARFSKDIVLRGNVVTNSSWWGTVFWSWCSNITLRDNEYYGSGIQVYDGSSSFDIDTSNTVDGSPIYFFSDKVGGTVPTGAGQVVLANCIDVTVESQGWDVICRQIALEDCSNCVVTNNNITPAGAEGIQLICSPSNTIDNNTVNGGAFCIRLEASSYCRVENNSVSDCINWGIFIQGSDFVSILDNHCEGCSLGILLNSLRYSLATRNWIDNSTSDGLCLADSAFVTITNNAFIDNSRYGVYVSSSVIYPSLIANNSFIRNYGTGEVWTGRSQAYDDSGLISWSQGSYGNYWLDWRSPDDDGDGIVDLPYIISGGAGAYDPYPLTMAPPAADNTPPTASFTVSPSAGEVGTIFCLNASSSSDAEDDSSVLEVRWDINGDGVWDTEWCTDKVAYPQYTAPGVYVVRLEVRDTQGLTAVAEVSIVVMDIIPEFPASVATVLPLLLLVAVVAGGRFRRRQRARSKPG